MARRAAVAEVQESEQGFAADPGMPSAPGGSAARVTGPTCMDCGWTEADCNCPTGFTVPFEGQVSGDGTGETLPPFDPDIERTAIVNTYDANCEAMAQEVPVVPAQTAMPGFEKPELWDRFEGRKITKVILSFAGTCDLSQDPDLCRALRLRNEVGFTIEGQVTGKAFKLRTDKNGVTTVDGVATLNVTEVRGEGEDRDLEAVREAAFAQAQELISGEAAELLELIESDGGGAEGAADREERVRVFLRSIVMPSGGDAHDEVAEDLAPSALEASLDIALGTEPEADPE